MTKPRVLFILKQRMLQYGEQRAPYTTCISSGLLNSATFVHDMLLAQGYESKLVQVVDNNDIDREVTSFAPDVVIIEAYWVVPDKFEVLQQLHPDVTWIVRCHSELPFIQNEGMAIEWTLKYLQYENVLVAFNSLQTLDDFLRVVPEPNAGGLIYLPNYYPAPSRPDWFDRFFFPNHDIGYLDVGCFGAMRPQKNHLPQAFAAISYADQHNRQLRFHVNNARIEGRGDAALKNLRALFAGTNGRHQLIEHGWLSHSEFFTLMQSMDLSMQVSFTESFNIVSADAVAAGVPVVVSDQIDWVHPKFYADPTDVTSIVRAMTRALWLDRWMWWVDLNGSRLRAYATEAYEVWMQALDG